MKTHSSIKRERGLTLVELLVVLAVLFILAAIFLPAVFDKGPVRVFRIQCVNNLKQTGLAFRIWAEDHGTNFPMALSETNGGTMEFANSLNAFRHFQVLSNELYWPKVLICPADSDDRTVGTNFLNFCNSNLSFFVGIVANESNANMILSGDRNITTGTTIRNGMLALTTNTPAVWTSEMHNKVGNVALADGSVQQVNITGLQNLITGTGVVTNWVQMPVLGP